MLDSVMSRQMQGKDTIVLSWVRTASGACYVGTYHSLYGYDGQKMRLLQGDLDKVRSMAYSEPSQSLYLLSRSRGVCRWHEGRLTVLSDSTQFRHLRLQGDSALLLSEGVDGVRMLNLKTGKITADTTTAEVSPVATAYDADGHRQPVTFGQENLTLPRGTDFVEICLSTLDFEHASQVQFAYRTDDGEAWTPLPEGEHVVKISRLPAGITRLQVRATDELGRWSAPAQVLTIVRPALWYERVWLWAVFALVALGAGYTLVRKAKQSKTAELSEESTPQSLPVADQEFLDKAMAAVSDHMTDSDYSVDALAGDLCMSRANLHRKMRTITGQTPTDFIRNKRLERAAQMLRTTSYSVNEIADLVGFSYASYFTKCFKEKYGVMPKDYRI
jgi:AraC-like DNA-binding protein